MVQEKERLQEIEGFFHTLQEKVAKYQKYFAALSTLPSTARPKIVFAESGNSSVTRGEIENARLESNFRRDY